MSHLPRLVALAFAVAVFGCGRPAANPVPALSPAPALDPAAPDVAESTQYRDWANFPVGTVLTQRTTTDSAKTPGQTLTTITFALMEMSDTALVVQWQATTEYHGGRGDKKPPVTGRRARFIKLAAGGEKED